MGKKINNPKLLKKSVGPNESMLSVFNKFANRISESRRKKIEKVGDTKQRLMEAKKTNKIIKVSKRTSKFSLLEDEENAPKGLTHRGKNINQLKQFNDMNFGSDVDDEEFNKMHQNLNFTGFDEEEQKPEDDGRPKSKNEVYKEIIEKSKLHKHLRQEMYEENFNKAVELDQQFPQFTNSLKFRNRDSNVKERLASNTDHDFEKLANELKEDEKVVSNKVIEKNQKYTDKIRKKKTEQLNSLMKDSSEEEGDIRGWVKNVNEDLNGAEEEDEDELDEVQLSSGEEGGSEEAEENDSHGLASESQGQEIAQSESEVIPAKYTKKTQKKHKNR